MFWLVEKKKRFFVDLETGGLLEAATPSVINVIVSGNNLLVRLRKLGITKHTHQGLAGDRGWWWMSQLADMGGGGGGVQNSPLGR